MGTFDEEVRLLALARRDEAAAGARLERLMAEIEEQHPELAEARAAHEAAKARSSSADAQVRMRVANRYNVVGEKPDHPALGIKQYTRPQYPEDIALVWAVEHGLVGLLRLNKKLFEQVGPVILPSLCDWGRVEAVATVATDLSKWAVELEGAEEPAGAPV